jgi:hypothetical protein
MGTPTLDTSDSGAQAEQRDPFQGLGFYTEDDAPWFFGRAPERKIILAHLRTARLTLLYAESGVGKSSLLRAGVAARLRELSDRTQEAGRSARFIPIVFSAWKDEPVADLIAEIRRHAGPQPAGENAHTAPSASGAGPARGGLATAITDAAAKLDGTLVIILDQFEEHLGYRQGGDGADRLADELAECINSPDVPANFLIAVREDAYGGLGDLFSGRISNIYGNYLHLEYLTRDAAREAIEKPVALYNEQRADRPPVTVEPELTEAVLNEVRRGRLELGRVRPDRNGAGTRSDAREDAIETPFLQLVMTRLWECELAENSHVLRRATLDERLGGAEAIVRTHVDRALAGLSGDELDAATDIFRDLVTPSGVKVAHTADDLARMTGHPLPAPSMPAMRSSTTGWRRRSSTGAISRTTRGWNVPGRTLSSRRGRSGRRPSDIADVRESCSGSWWVCSWRWWPSLFCSGTPGTRPRPPRGQSAWRRETRPRRGTSASRIGQARH